MYQIQALPGAALEYVYPPVDAELAKVPYKPGYPLYDDALAGAALFARALFPPPPAVSQLHEACPGVMHCVDCWIQHPSCSIGAMTHAPLALVPMLYLLRLALCCLPRLEPSTMLQTTLPYTALCRTPLPAVQVLIGRDMLGVPMYREVTLAQIRARDQRLLIGPYRLLEGFMAMCEFVHATRNPSSPQSHRSSGLQVRPLGLIWFITGFTRLAIYGTGPSLVGPAHACAGTAWSALVRLAAISLVCA